MNFAKYTGKPLRQSLFFNKVAGLNFLTEYLRATASDATRIMQLNIHNIQIKPVDSYQNRNCIKRLEITTEEAVLIWLFK